MTELWNCLKNGCCTEEATKGIKERGKKKRDGNLVSLLLNLPTNPSKHSFFQDPESDSWWNHDLELECIFYFELQKLGHNVCCDYCSWRWQFNSISRIYVAFHYHNPNWPSPVLNICWLLEHIWHPNLWWSNYKW